MKRSLFSMRGHGFDSGLAYNLGLPAAIIYNHICWFYPGSNPFTRELLMNICDYLTKEEIDFGIEILISNELITVENSKISPVKEVE